MRARLACLLAMMLVMASCASSSPSAPPEPVTSAPATIRTASPSPALSTPASSGSASTAQTALASSEPGPTYVVVQPGDTLAGVGRSYEVTVEELLAANPQITDPDRIGVGDRIAIPGALFTGDLVTILDTLGAATPATTFSISGAGGSDNDIGPLFTLAQPTRITEIGGFVTDLTHGQSKGWLEIEICPALRNPFARLGVYFVSDCPPPVATFALPRPALDTYAYESVAPDLVLPAGHYFAVFTNMADASGGLLWQASDPFAYRPASIEVWYAGSSAQSTHVPLAVRVLGRSLAAWAPTPAPVRPLEPPCPPPADLTSPEPASSPSESSTTISEAAEAYQALMVADYGLVRNANVRYSDSSVPCGLWSGGPCTTGQMAAGKSYWRAIAAAEGAYVTGLQAIPFPDAVAAQVRAVREAAGRAQCWADAAANAMTVGTLNAFAAEAASASDERWGPESMLMEALGLPVGNCGEGCAASPAPSDGAP